MEKSWEESGGERLTSPLHTRYKDPIFFLCQDEERTSKAPYEGSCESKNPPRGRRNGEGTQGSVPEHHGSGAAAGASYLPRDGAYALSRVSILQQSARARLR